MSVLSIYLKQHPDEHPVGFLLRLAFQNGFTAIHQLFLKSQFDTLCRGTGKKFEDLCSQFSFTLHQSAILKPVARSTVRVCPACIEELRYIKAKWQSSEIFHCEVHKLALIDTCESCHQPLAWDINLLESRCTHADCGQKLPHIFSHMTETEHRYADECYIAGVWCQEQSNIALGNSNRVKLAQEIGYGFLKSTKTAEHYLGVYEKTIRSNSLPQLLRKFTLYKLASSLNSLWETRPIIEKFLDSPLPLYVDSEINFRIEVGEFCNLVGIDRTTLELLVSKDLVVKEGNRCRILPNTRVEVSRLFTLLNRNSKSINSAKSLLEWRELIEACCQTYALMLVACLEGNLRYNYQPKDSLFDSIHVTEKDLRDALLSNMNNIKDKAIRLQQVEIITGMSPKSIKKAIVDGKLRLEATERFNYNQSLLLSEASMLLNLNTKQHHLPLWD